MKKLFSNIPLHVTVLLQRLGIVLLTLFTTRILFFAFNYEAFPQVRFLDLILAIWFDLITIGLFFIPYYIFFLLPIPIRGYRWNEVFFKVLFHLTNGLLIALNLLDVEYFKYTSKRSTFDLFSILSAGSDFKQLATTFIKDFWFLLLALIILIALSEYLYRKTQIKLKTFATKGKNFYLINVLAFIILAPTIFIIGRGGFALKPIGIIEASTYTKGINTTLVMTTPFTMVKTIDQQGVTPKNYFTEKELNTYFNPIKESKPQHILPDGTNVMIILLESFGIEFIGAYNHGESYTPFLDSLIEKSLYFEYGFANGKKSIEAIPAVIASMPTLMDNPYISSPYGDNRINTLPNILKKSGYESAFYHGATNGSMRFDGFSTLCGYDHYLGRYEYNNDDHFDKTWGILDEYFNPWTAKKMSELKQPFFSTLFTLSSHHPYFIPDHIKDKIKTGPQPICASINYGDYALKQFFDEAKKQPWFNNTLFVIMADHTPASTTPEYNTRTHMYRIPIVFHHPKGLIKPEKKKEIFQQLDVLPTILDLLNIKTTYYSFGNSHYQNTHKEAIAYIEGTYTYFKNGHMTNFINEKARNLYDFRVQSTTPVDSFEFYKNEVLENENRIKAIIQHYNGDLILNETTTE